MPDVLLRQLWLAAIIVRGLAIPICRRRVPNWWLAWAIFSEVAAITLRLCDYQHWSWYQQGWMVEQWVSAALLVMVTRETAKPSGFAAFLAFTASLFSVTVIHVSQHFKLAWLQFTMEGTGCDLLALGIMAIMSVIAFRTNSRMILSGYLILSSLMLLVAPEYLASPGLGRAWNILEIAAFIAWSAIYTRNEKIS